tara:strand:- start:57 stop:977 length:921 start_codon:yes stop_codon:yes gene_type:complete
MKNFGRTGIKLPEIGFGTWGIGGGRWSPSYNNHAEMVKLVRNAIDEGLTIIDTAEMYGGGHTEEIVGEAVEDRRDKAFIMSKLWATNTGYESALKHAEASLRRMRTDYLDLYFIHSPPLLRGLRDTMMAFEKLVLDGKVRYIGLSNFSPKKIEEARTYLSRIDVSAVQNRYSLIMRGDELDVIPYCEKEGIAYIAYSPLGGGSLISDQRVINLKKIASKYGKDIVSIALNWLIKGNSVFTIPKTSNPNRIKYFKEGMEWKMDTGDYNYIGNIFKQRSHGILDRLLRTVHDLSIENTSFKRSTNRIS